MSSILHQRICLKLLSGVQFTMKPELPMFRSSHHSSYQQLPRSAASQQRRRGAPSNNRIPSAAPSACNCGEHTAADLFDDQNDLYEPYDNEDLNSAIESFTDFCSHLQSSNPAFHPPSQLPEQESYQEPSTASANPTAPVEEHSRPANQDRPQHNERLLRMRNHPLRHPDRQAVELVPLSLYRVSQAIWQCLRYFRHLPLLPTFVARAEALRKNLRLRSQAAVLLLRELRV